MNAVDSSIESSTPQLDIRHGKATITLSRPAQHNRLEPADLKALTKMFLEMDDNPDVRVLVITGTGKSFSSGFHLGAIAEDHEGKGGKENQAPNAFETMVNALEAMKIPTIAALNGGVYGGATDLVLACDFRIGVEGIRMFMPAARLGIVYYESGLRRYVTRLGLNNAKRLFMTAEPVEAPAMLEMGYLTEIVPADQLETRVDALAGQLASNAPLAVSAMKQSLNAVAAGRLDSDHHRELKEMCMASEDHKEGIKAWTEKRKPVFHGR